MIQLTQDERLQQEKEAGVLEKLLKGESLAVGGIWPGDPVTKDLYKDVLDAEKDILLQRYRLGKCFAEALEYGGEKELRIVLGAIKAKLKEELGPIYEAFPEKPTRQTAEKAMYFAEVVEARGITIPCQTRMLH